MFKRYIFKNHCVTLCLLYVFVMSEEMSFISLELPFRSFLSVVYYIHMFIFLKLINIVYTNFKDIGGVTSTGQYIEGVYHLCIFQLFFNDLKIYVQF